MTSPPPSPTSVLLKLSGEAHGRADLGIDPIVATQIARRAEIQGMGVPDGDCDRRLQYFWLGRERSGWTRGQPITWHDARNQAWREDAGEQQDCRDRVVPASRAAIARRSSPARPPPREGESRGFGAARATVLRNDTAAAFEP